MDASHLTANVIKLTQAKMVSILSDTKKKSNTGTQMYWNQCIYNFTLNSSHSRRLLLTQAREPHDYKGFCLTSYPMERSAVLTKHSFITTFMGNIPWSTVSAHLLIHQLHFISHSQVIMHAVLLVVHLLLWRPLILFPPASFPFYFPL